MSQQTFTDYRVNQVNYRVNLSFVKCEIAIEYDKNDRKDRKSIKRKKNEKKLKTNCSLK